MLLIQTLYSLQGTNRLTLSLQGCCSVVGDGTFVQGAFFYCSALKMTKCQPDREISELFLPKKQLRIKVPELFRTGPLPKMTKEKVQATQLLW